MGQPIYLKRKGKPDLVVYGPAQAAVHIAQGWQHADPEQVASGVRADDLTAINGVGEHFAEQLAGIGFVTYVAIAEAPVKNLTALNGVGKETADLLKASAAKLT